MLARIHQLALHVAQRGNLAADCIILCAASVISTYAAEGQVIPLVSAVLSAVSIAVWLSCVRVLRHYEPEKAQGFVGELAITSLLVGASGGVLWLLRFLLPAYTAPSHLPTFFTVAMYGTLSVSSVLYGRRLYRERKPNQVLIVGAGALGYYTGIELRDRFQRKLAGYLLLPNQKAHQDLPAPFLGPSEDLPKLLSKQGYDEIYLAGSLLWHGEAIRKSAQTCELYGIPFAMPMSHFRMARARPKYPRTVKDGYIHFVTFERKPVQMSLKRLFDIAVSLSVLTLVLPLMLVTAAAIKLTSKGPVFFRQKRVGIYGRPFNMLKFRSMVINAEALKSSLEAQNEADGPVFKIKKDPRITPVGRFIRKFSIDELPQLINVLRGDMAIVGPRPALPNEVSQYEAWQKRRLSVRPGITCEWQVSGRNDIPFEQWMYLDMHYIDHWSLFSDIVLLFKTIPVVVRGKGAS